MGEWDRRSWERPGAEKAEEEGPDAEEQMTQLRMTAARHKRGLARKAEREAGPDRVGIPEGGGAPLDAGVRKKMEGHLGGDLSNVRVHTSGDSAKAASQLGARAFTDGHDVHFNAGQFAPGSKEGDRLLAHELTHVVQGQKSGVQRKEEEKKPEDGGGKDAGAKDAGGKDAAVEVSKPEDAAEVEADKVGDDVAEKEHGGDEKKKGDKEKAGEKAEKKDGEKEGEAGEKEGEAGEKKEGEKADGEKADAEKADGGGDDKPDEKKAEEKKGEAKPDEKKAEKPAEISAKYEGVGRMIFRDDKGEKKDEKKEPAGGAEGKKKPVEPPKLDEERAMKILEESYGGLKTIVKGKVEVLPLAQFKAAWQAIWGGGPYDWDTYVKVPPNGFADIPNGINYINKDQAGTHTVVHEVLHNNRSGDWLATMGSKMDEGVVDWLTVEACNAKNEPAPVCYPTENAVAQTLAGVIGADTLKAAYFQGGAAAKVAGTVDTTCKGKWTDVRAAVEAGDAATAQAKLQKK
jgi:hypothetical protein